jgi:tRNA-dihydrouridine synthase
MYRGSADWNAIAHAVQVARGTDTLVFGNGDVQTMQDAVTRVQTTGVHGVLIGRGTLGAPWFFRTKALARARAALRSQEADVHDGQDVELHLNVSLDERFGVMIEHAREFEAIFGGDAFPRMRKHLGWYCKGFPHAAALRASMVRASSSRDVEDLLARHHAHAGSPAMTFAGPPPTAAAPCV